MRPSKCPMCGGPGTHAFSAPDYNLGIGGRNFVFERCDVCTTLFQPTVPENLGCYYPDEYYLLPTLDELRVQAQAEGYQMDLVRPHAMAGHLTEVGPGRGIFAVQARDAGFDVTAVEMDRRTTDYLREVVGVRAIASDAPEEVLDNLEPSRVIALWHVIEHLPRPRAFLEAAARNLEPGGAMVIATPNPASFGFRVLGARWPHVDAPRHLSLIPAHALIAVAREQGLDVLSFDTDDVGARGWNRFAWEYLMRTPRSGRVHRELARRAGAVMAGALAPVERRPMRGASYTVVLGRRAVE